MKETMIQHSLQGQGEIRQAIKEKVLNLRKHNYILGFDEAENPNMQVQDINKNQALQEAARAKSISQIMAQPKPVLNSQNIRKSHFEISHSKQNNDYKSISRIA